MTAAADAPPPPEGASDVPDSDLSTRLEKAQIRAADAHRDQLAAEEKARAAEEAQIEAELLLVEALAELESLRAHAGASRPTTSADNRGTDGAEGPFSLFQDRLTSQPSLAADGSDPGVLPIALGGTALVGAMVVFLATLNGRLLQPFGITMVVITAALAYFAWRTRVERIEVQVSKGGVVYVERSNSGSLRFDLRSDATHVAMTGRPGTTEWSMTFTSKRGSEPFIVTPAMVDSVDFTLRVRSYRPDL